MFTGLTIAGVLKWATGPVGRYVVIGLAAVILAGVIYWAGVDAGGDKAETDALKHNQEKVRDALKGKDKVDRDVSNDSDRELIERMRREGR